MQTVHLEQGLIDNLKLEFNTQNTKEAILELYQFYMDSKKREIDKNTQLEAQNILQGIKDIEQGKTKNIQKLFDAL